jgi:hypothetical protein
MVVSVRFWHVFGLSVESVEAQPIYGHKTGDEENEQVFFFDGYIINIPFIKIMLGDVWGLADD